ncbi:hypothetical protein FPOAC1_005818 [Fusarium poae]|uniref:hypothetical protein n=1 Tax=Fusarium poae TaxID=36050 RepID=UPI001CEA389F|nr:hypothetical protein FPOAC1_005818 [Fusarium poae]KAG8672542.1 hypothetical protein FPOAC1_005818 [Fusarium poae]
MSRLKKTVLSALKIMAALYVELFFQRKLDPLGSHSPQGPKLGQSSLSAPSMSRELNAGVHNCAFTTISLAYIIDVCPVPPTEPSSSNPSKIHDRDLIAFDSNHFLLAVATSASSADPFSSTSVALANLFHPGKTYRPRRAEIE